MAQQKAQFQSQHQAAIAKLSPAARKADAELLAVANNPSLTQIERTQKLKAIFDSLPPSVVKELQQGP
ncbi:hypothetical protein AB6A40_002832 [Gnathostoma spinigerum]|uniref:Uncharacterized protein n=1 Tax=Gnathostoma spinigerum TaxID=75299 RepID=A0ABD6EGP8_9BILA